MEIVVLTSDKTNWLLPGFAHQFNKYWDAKQRVLVAGFTRDADVAKLPANFEFYSIGAFVEYPVNKWTDALIALIQNRMKGVAHFALLLEDYWLNRRADLDAVNVLAAWMKLNPGVARMDLTSDRAFSKDWRICEHVGRFDLIQSPVQSQYYMSFQAGIWQRDILLETLMPGQTPWDCELIGSQTLGRSKRPVMGTLQRPLSYVIVNNKGKFALKGDWQFPSASFSSHDLEELKEMAYVDGA